MIQQMREILDRYHAAIERHGDVHKAFPQTFHENVWDGIVWKSDADIDAYADRLRRTASYSAWRLLRVLSVLALTRAPALRRLFPSVSTEKDWRD